MILHLLPLAVDEVLHHFWVKNSVNAWSALNEGGNFIVVLFGKKDVQVVESGICNWFLFRLEPSEFWHPWWSLKALSSNASMMHCIVCFISWTRMLAFYKLHWHYENISKTKLYMELLGVVKYQCPKIMQKGLIKSDQKFQTILNYPNDFQIVCRKETRLNSTR